MDLVSPANGRLAGQVNVRPYYAIWANIHPRIGDSIRAHLDGLVHAGLWIDDGGGMNVCSHSSIRGITPVNNGVDSNTMRP